MSLLPDIIDGKLTEMPKPQRIPIPRRRKVLTDEEKLEALNNEGLKIMSEDFSDSPHADREPIKEDGK